jgi:hypothetical protein
MASAEGAGPTKLAARMRTEAAIEADRVGIVES